MYVSDISKDDSQKKNIIESMNTSASLHLVKRIVVFFGYKYNLFSSVSLSLLNSPFTWYASFQSFEFTQNVCPWVPIPLSN